MPYPIASTYIAVVETPDGTALTATMVAATGGQSGHTARAEVKIFSPGYTRLAAQTAAHSFYSSAVAYIPLCDGDNCQDGTYQAEGWGEEFCAVVSQYMTLASVYQTKEVAPFVEVTSVSSQHTSIAKQNGKTSLTARARRSANCSNAEIAVSLAPPGSMAISMEPTNGVGAPSWQGLGGSIVVVAITAPNNEVTGNVEGQAAIHSTLGDCQPRGLTKTVMFEVK